MRINITHKRKPKLMHIFTIFVVKNTIHKYGLDKLNPSNNSNKFSNKNLCGIDNYYIVRDHFTFMNLLKIIKNELWHLLASWAGYSFCV